jgi:hypothetical protein
MVGRMSWLDVDPDDPGRILELGREPLLEPGQPGTFDENGLLPTCLVQVGDELRCYYVGYQLGAQVRYYQFAGLAISRDGGQTFERWRRTPLLERSEAELVNRTSTFVMPHGDGFRMWYVGGSEWAWVDGPEGRKHMPCYSLRVIDSRDGLSWPDRGRVVLELDEDVYAFGRPWVVPRPDGGWRMFYSYRTRSRGYRIGMADSSDLESWIRRDDEVGIDVSPSGWDSESIEYGALFRHGERVYLFYNGNRCGATGFGWAELQAW